MNTQDNSDIRDQVELTDPTKMYNIKGKDGQTIQYEKASGRELFNHYRHNMTSYDQVLDDVRSNQGHVTGRQEKKAAVGAAEQILELYRDEHVKVIQDSQKKGNVLKSLMQKAGVGTAAALSNLLDNWSTKIKEIAQLENSQRSLQLWNDTYRVHQKLVLQVLIKEDVSQEVLDKVKAIYSTRSVNKAIDMGTNLLDLEKSEILKLIKTAVRYANLKLGETE